MSKRWIGSLVVGLFWGFHCPASADEINGDNGAKLARECQLALSHEKLSPDDARSAGVCLGYVHGMLGMNVMYQMADATRPELSFCPPAGRTTLVIGAQVFTRYIERHPDALPEASQRALLDAFRDAWPCEVAPGH